MPLGGSREKERWLPRERSVDSQCQRLHCFHCHGHRDLPLTLLLLTPHRQHEFTQYSTEYGDGQPGKGSSGIAKKRSVEERRTRGARGSSYPRVLRVSTGSRGGHIRPQPYPESTRRKPSKYKQSSDILSSTKPFQYIPPNDVTLCPVVRTGAGDGTDR